MAGVAYRPRYTVRDYLSWEGDWELIVDPDCKAVELLVLGKDDRYASAPPDADFALHSGCRLAIDPAALW